jgi:hypothetical protein
MKNFIRFNPFLNNCISGRRVRLFLSKKAFTLIELTFFMLIISFIIFSLILFILNISNFNVYLIFGLGKVNEIQLFLSEIKKELKSMELSNIGNYPIEEVSSTTIIFYSDLDNDGLVERIRYFLDQDKLKKGVVSPSGNPLRYDITQEKTKTVVRDIYLPNRIFTFYNENLNETYDIAKIRTVKVNVKAKIDLKGQTYEDYIVISPRNLKTK